MAELMMFGVFAVMIVALVVGWKALSHEDHEVMDDARSTVVAGPHGTMTVAVANPASEPVVVTACARPASSVRLRSRSHIRRAPTSQERRDASATAARQLLGSVGAGDQATWVVVGDATAAKVCRVVLRLYQSNGRVRVHEHLVATEGSALETGVSGHRALGRPHHSTTD